MPRPTLHTIERTGLPFCDEFVQLLILGIGYISPFQSFMVILSG